MSTRKPERNTRNNSSRLNYVLLVGMQANLKTRSIEAPQGQENDSWKTWLKQKALGNSEGLLDELSATLFNAVSSADFNAVDVILQDPRVPLIVNRMNKNADPSSRETLLTLSVRRGDIGAQVRILRRILTVPGVDPDAEDGQGYTPLMIASKYGYVSMIKMLLASGADVTYTNNETSQSSLDIARENARSAAVAILEPAFAERGVVTDTQELLEMTERNLAESNARIAILMEELEKAKLDEQLCQIEKEHIESEKLIMQKSNDEFSTSNTMLKQDKIRLLQRESELKAELENAKQRLEKVTQEINDGNPNKAPVVADKVSVVASNSDTKYSPVPWQLFENALFVARKAGPPDFINPNYGPVKDWDITENLMVYLTHPQPLEYFPLGKSYSLSKKPREGYLYPAVDPANWKNALYEARNAGPPRYVHSVYGPVKEWDCGDVLMAWVVQKTGYTLTPTLNNGKFLRI